jgi:hypothetical protein
MGHRLEAVVFRVEGPAGDGAGRLPPAS